jgi:hypothetical protein
MKPIDTFGKVFLPDKDTVIHGAKLYSNEQGIFIEYDSPFPDSHRNTELILGSFNSLGLATCLNNIYYGSQIGGGGNLCKYKVTDLITGAHFSKAEDAVFNKAIFYLNSLIEWFDKKGIKHTFTPKKTIEYGTFQTIDLEINGFDKSRFNFGYSLQMSQHSASVSDTVIFYLESDDPKSIQSFFKVINKLRKLFSFLTDSNFEIDNISLYNNNIKHEFGGKITDSLVELKLYGQSRSISPCQTSHFLNIKYIDIEDNFKELIKNWLMISEDNFVIDLLLEKASNPDLSLRTYFLNVCFALEVYHKNKISNQKLSTEDFKTIKDYLKIVIKDKMVKEWITNKIGLGNHPSFKDRLVYFRPNLEAVYSADVDLLINKIINTRNFLVHSTAEKQYIVKEDYELYSISITLEVLVKRLMLKDLGIKNSSLDLLNKEAKRHIDHFLRNKQA